MLKTLVRRMRGRPQKHDFEFVPEGWRRAQRAEIKGWNEASVVETQLARWQATRPRLAAAAPLGSAADGVGCDLATHNTLVSFAYAAALASRNSTRLSLLDWGGGIGQYGEIAAAVLPGVEIDYACKDVPVQCAAGRRLAPRSAFFTDDEAFAGRSFDLVLASGALQYVEDWQRVLRRLANAAGRYLFVTRLPVVSEAASFVILQRAQAYGYNTEYLGWCLNRQEFLAASAACGVSLVREFCLEPPCSIPAAPAPWQSRGYLFSAAERE